MPFFHKILFIAPYTTTTSSIFLFTNNNSDNEATVSLINLFTTVDDNNLKDKKKKTELTASDTIPVDTDKDGVSDEKDLCPDIPGSKNAKGCPDTDGDGIADFEDLCLNTPGLPQFKGCPDADNDGVPDNLDACPNEKGAVLNNGCPVVVAQTAAENKPLEVIVIAPRKDVFYSDPVQKIDDILYNKYLEQKWIDENAALLAANNKVSAKVAKTQLPEDDSVNTQASAVTDNKLEVDTDGDGIIDIEDKCPAIVGLKSNNGCPLLTTYKAVKVSQRDIILSNEETKLIEDVFNNLSFESGRIILSNSSYTLLDQFADLLNKKYSWIITLHCYTNEADNSYRNQQLSYNRGDHIRGLLVRRGVTANRIQIKGWGDSIANQGLLPNRIELEISR